MSRDDLADVALFGAIDDRHALTFDRSGQLLGVWGTDRDALRPVACRRVPRWVRLCILATVVTAPLGYAVSAWPGMWLGCAPAVFGWVAVRAFRDEALR